MTRKDQESAIRGLWEREPGSGVWWIRYRDAEGKLHREKAGRRSDAVALLEKRRTERRRGAKMPENLRIAPIRFDELADAIEVYSRAHHGDSRNVLQRLKTLRASFGERVAETIKPEEVDRWLTANTQTAATANRYRAVLSLVYREALRNGKVKSNPVRLVRQRKEENSVIRFLTDAEETRLRKVIAEHYPEQMDELDVSIGTGMRLSEQYGERLLWEQVDFVRKEIRLRKTKNGHARVIPMNVAVLAAMIHRRSQLPNAKEKAPVFPQPPRWWWENAREKAGLQDYRWHDNRHTFCSRLAMRKVNLVAIKELAGHKTLSITARYAHLDDAALREAVDLLPGLVSA